MQQEYSVVHMAEHTVAVDNTAAKKAVSHGDLGIVISGEPGAGKTTFAKEVAEYYGKEVYSVGEFWRKEYEKYKEEHQSGYSTFEHYWGDIPLSKQRDANRGLKQYVARGMVVETRYVQIFPNKDECLIIYVHAPIEVRAERIKERPEYSGKTSTEIEVILKKRQKDEVEVGMKLFGSDYRNAKFYDLIFDSSVLTPKEELSATEALMRKKLMGLVRK